VSLGTRQIKATEGKKHKHKSHYLCDSKVVLPSSFSCLNSPLAWSALNFSRQCGKVCTDRLTNYFVQGSYLPSPFLRRAMEQLSVRNIRVTLTRCTVIPRRINILNSKSRHWKQPLAYLTHFPSSWLVIVKLIFVKLQSSLTSEYFNRFFILKFRRHFSFLVRPIFPAHPALQRVEILVIPSQIKIMAT
jgi:hypothetical protein